MNKRTGTIFRDEYYVCSPNAGQQEGPDKNARPFLLPKERRLREKAMERKAEGKIGNPLADEKDAYDQADGDGGDERMEQRNHAQHKGCNGE